MYGRIWVWPMVWHYVSPQCDVITSLHHVSSQYDVMWRHYDFLGWNNYEMSDAGGAWTLQRFLGDLMVFIIAQWFYHVKPCKLQEKLSLWKSLLQNPNDFFGKSFGPCRREFWWESFSCNLFEVDILRFDLGWLDYHWKTGVWIYDSSPSEEGYVE